MASPYQPRPTLPNGQVPIELDQMPTPAQSSAVIPNPAATENSYAEQPPGSGYMGTTGKVADIASQFLHGWLRGKQYAQVRKIQDAENQVRGAKSTFDIAQQAYNNYVQNPDLQKNDPEGFKKSSDALMHSWQTYTGTMKNYVQPEEMGADGNPTGKPAKKGIGGRIKDAFVPTTPHLYSQAALSVLSGMDPRHMITQTAQGKQAAATAKGAESTASILDTQAQKDKFGFAETQEAHNLRNAYENDINGYNTIKKAADAGDASAQSKLPALEADLRFQQSKLASRGVKVDSPGAITIAGQNEQIQQQKNSALSSGMEKMQNGQQNSMTPLEREALGQNPRQAFDAYMQQVGPGLKFPTTLAASQAWMKDQGDMYRNMYMGRGVWGQNWEYTEQNIRAAHPDWNDEQVANGVIGEMEKFRAGRGGSYGTPLLKPDAIRQGRADVFQQTLAEHPEYSRFLQYEVQDKNGNPQTVFSFNPEAMQPKQGGWFSKGEDPKSFAQAKDSAYQAVRDTAKRMGYSDNQVSQLVGGLGQSGAAPAGNPAPTAKSPGANPATQQSPGRQYRVTDPSGASKVITIPDSLIQQVKAQAPPGSKVEAVAGSGGTD